MLTRMTPAQKRMTGLLALCALVLIVDQVFGPSGDDSVAGHVSIAVPLRPGPDRAMRSDAAGSTATNALQLDRLEARKNGSADESNTTDIAPLFEARSWLPPPPPPPPAIPPPKPQAPPFTYTYMGGLSEDGKRINFFSKGERVLSVKSGDTVDGAFRIDEISETQMTMTYLPLNEKVILTLGQR